MLAAAQSVPDRGLTRPGAQGLSRGGVRGALSADREGRRRGHEGSPPGSPIAVHGSSLSGMVCSHPVTIDGWGSSFELVVNFGRDEDALQAATDELERRPTVQVRDLHVPLSTPSLTRVRSDDQLIYIEFAVWPIGISSHLYFGPGRDPDEVPPIRARDLTDDELTSVGEQLYDLLKRFNGYEVATVGWDPEVLVEVGFLESDYVPDGSISRVDGLVLSDALIERWKPQGFLPFSRGYSWVPYRGSHNILGPAPN